MKPHISPLLTTVECDFRGQVSQWLDETQAAPFVSSECQQDLQRLDRLRRTVCSALSSHETALENIGALQEYAAALDECIKRGFPANEDQAADGGSSLAFCWRKGDIDATYKSFTWERANVILNLAILEAYKATKQTLTNPMAWKKAVDFLQNAASLVKELRTNVLLKDSADDCPELDNVLFYEHFFLAEAQRCAYETFKCMPRPTHFMLAKIAAASFPLYNQAEELDNESDAARIYGMYMTIMACYHQAKVHETNKEYGAELARLQMATRFARLCKDYCETSRENMTDLWTSLDPLLLEMEERQAQQERNVTVERSIPDPDDLPEIQPKVTVKLSSNVSNLLPPLQQPLFSSVVPQSSLVRKYVSSFRKDLDKIVVQYATLAQQKTDSARQTLATVNLPHSLTAFRQEQNGGGIPEELWERIRQIQEEGRDVRLTQDMWELRDLAEAARDTYKSIISQLDEDLQMDSLFREEHADFEGLSVEEVQSSFRNALANYDRLMVAARESDDLLLERCQILEEDAKFQLLKFSKSQLDRLLPRVTERVDGDAVDTTKLSKLLVDLSALFEERERLVATLREQVKSIDIADDIAMVDPEAPGAEEAFKACAERAKHILDPLVDRILSSIEEQKDLLHSILKENEAFMVARDAHRSVSGGSCIVTIEDALEEMDQFAKHLKEGRAFYDVIIPKLDKLRQHVGDLSARLTVERCEYEDRARRSRQEEQDARMAATLFERHQRENEVRRESGQDNVADDIPREIGGVPRVIDTSIGDVASTAEVAPVSTSPESRRPEPYHATPGVEQVLHDEPDVRVDHDKAATLIAMDFDPDKVVAALKKCDNNVEAALNELLSC